MFLFDLSDATKAGVNTALTYILNSIMAAQMLASFLIFFKAIYFKCKKRKQEGTIKVHPVSLELGEDSSNSLREKPGLSETRHLANSSMMEGEVPHFFKQGSSDEILWGTNHDSPRKFTKTRLS